MKTILVEKIGYHLPDNSGATRVIPKRPWPPETNLLRFLLVLSTNFQLWENKRK